MTQIFDEQDDEADMDPDIWDLDLDDDEDLGQNMSMKDLVTSPTITATLDTLTPSAELTKAQNICKRDNSHLDSAGSVQEEGKEVLSDRTNWRYP